MRKAMLVLGALSLTAPVALVVPTTSVEAKQPHRYRNGNRVYRGQNNRYYCQKRGGTTGAVVGGVGGALLGSAIGGTGATILGAGAGALGGRAIERNRSVRNCR